MTTIPPGREVQRLVPSLWFARTAAEAVDFYVAAFRDAAPAEPAPSGGEDTGVVAVSHYPTDGLAEGQAAFAGEVLEIRFRLAGLEFSAINAGDEFRPNPAISFTVFVDPDRDGGTGRLDALFDRLRDGGQELMPLGEYPFARRFGWVADRYGVTWQLTTAAPHEAATASEVGVAARVEHGEASGSTAVGDGDVATPDGRRAPALRIVPTLMFPHGEGRAVEAAELYTQVFERAFGGSGLGELTFYPAEAGQGTNAMLQGWIRLAGQDVTMMDSGAPHAFTFDLGVSLVVQCSTQEQIDEVWQGLSAVPEAEVCGWLRDRFGVSWQISPENMTELMGRRGAWQVMSTMRRPVLADFEALPRD